MKAALAIAFLAVSGVVYYVGFYPPSVMQRAAANMLETINDAAATKDRTRLASALQVALADDATVHLDVHFLSLTSESKPFIQDFDKQGFIQFIDSVLTPLSGFEYRAQLGAFAASSDRKTAAAEFSSTQWGDGIVPYGEAKVEMRYSAEALCKTELAYAGAPKLRKADCTLQMRRVPKPGQADKFRDMNALQDLLKKN